MLTPKQLQSLPKPLTDIYSELSDFVLQDIAMRISKAAKITDTAEYQLYRARALGMSKDEITAEIARINGVAQIKIEELIREAAERSDEFDRRMLGVGSTADDRQLQKLMAAQIEQTRGLCTNLTGTLGFAQRTADGRMVYGSATDFLRKQMDMAQMKVMTGVCDYNTAIRQACYALADSGLRTVYYASGRSDRIEVAVRRALMTGVSQLTQKISEQNAAEFGADGWEISAHMGARPSHAVYQGRQYPDSQYETIVLPLITDYNCRHSAYPIIMGVTKPAYTDEELRALDPPPFTYEGRPYTAYEAQQQMRKMERAMRRQKDRCVVADAVGDKDAFTAASIKLRRQKDYYEDFCKAAGTYTEYERTFVAGYDRHLAGKTGAVTKAQNKFKNAQITLDQIHPLTKDGNGGIIKEKTFKTFSNGDEVNEFFGGKGVLQKKNSAEGKWLKSLSAGEEQVVSDYCGDEYYDLNAYLRHIGDWKSLNSDYMDKFVKNLDSAIDKFELTDNITVFRGVDKNAISNLDLKRLVGEIYEDKGYMSTSPIRPNIVEDRPVLFEIQVPLGKGKGAYVNSLSGFKDEEYEFLLKRGTKCVVTSVDLTGDKPIIRMRVIDDD